jgi:hypothetical protein
MQLSIKNRLTCSKTAEPVPLMKKIRVLSTLTNAVNMEQVHGLILGNRTVIIKVSNRLQISHAFAYQIVHHRGITVWTHVMIFWTCIMRKGDESWIHPYEPESYH